MKIAQQHPSDKRRSMYQAALTDSSQAEPSTYELIQIPREIYTLVSHEIYKTKHDLKSTVLS